MAHVKIKNAFHVPSCETYNISKAKRGKACGCICFGCKQKLIAVKKTIAHHFRHETETNCNGAPETGLHQLGKQIIVDKLRMHLPKYGLIQFSNAVAELDLHSFRPDVTAEYDGKKIFFEVAVTHFVEPNKKQFFIEQAHRAIEINLSGLPYDALYKQVEEAVLNNLYNKKILSWDAETVIVENPAKEVVFGNLRIQTTLFPDTIETPRTDSSNTIDNIFKGILVLALLVIIYRWITSIKRRRNKRYRFA